MALLSAVSVKFVAMGLSKELAGAYNSAYGYLQLFAILADFGLYAVSVREVSAAKEKSKILGALIVLRIAIATLSLGGAVLIAWFMPAWQDSPVRIGIAIASLVPYFTLMAGVLRTIFQITYTMHYVFIAEVLQRVLTTGLMAGLIFMGVRLSTDIRVYELFLWVGAAGAVLLFALSVFFALRQMKIRLTFDRVLLLKLLKHAMPYGVAFLCIALYRQFDLTMIALLRDDFQIQNASYGFASRIAEMTYLVPTFLLNSTLPVLSERQSHGQSTKSLLGKTLLIVLTVGAASSLFSLLWSRPIMALLTTDAYLSTAIAPGSDTALSLLSAPMFLNGIVLYSFYVLLTKHEWKSLVVCMLLAVAISIGFNVSWIPESGFVGAIETSTIVHLFLAATLFPLAARSMPLSFPLSFTLRWAIFTGVLAAALWMTAGLLQDTVPSIIGLGLGALGTALLGFAVGFHKIFAFGGRAEELQIPE